MDWIDANQLGRRNLSPDAFKLLLGRRYNRTKKLVGGQVGNICAEKRLAQIEPVVSAQPEQSVVKPATTAESLAKKHGGQVPHAKKDVQEIKGIGQIDPSLSLKPVSTAETLAATHGVSRETVKRAAKFAADVAKNPRLIVS